MDRDTNELLIFCWLPVLYCHGHAIHNRLACMITEYKANWNFLMCVVCKRLVFKSRQKYVATDFNHKFFRSVPEMIVHSNSACDA